MNTPLQRDFLKNAAECAKAAERADDLEKRDVLRYLQDFWTNLAKFSPDYIDRMALDIAAIESMQAELIGMGPASH